MTQAHATPELVERLKIRASKMQPGSESREVIEEAADALEAQQARIAELEGLNDDLETANAAMFSHVEETVEQYRSAQALADRYEKALREIADDPYQFGQRVQRMKNIARQALSSQGRREGGER